MSDEHHNGDLRKAGGTIWPDTPKTVLVDMRNGRMKDDLAWGLIDSKYRPVIKGFVSKSLNKGLSGSLDDIVQEIMCRLYAAVKGINKDGQPIEEGFVKKEGSLFRNYCATVARRQVIDLWRREMARGFGRNVSFDETFGDGAGNFSADDMENASPAERAVMEGSSGPDLGAQDCRETDHGNDRGDDGLQSRDVLEGDCRWFEAMVEYAVNSILDSAAMDQVRREALVSLVRMKEDLQSVAARLGVKANTVSQWKSRFKEQVVAFLERYREDDQGFFELVKETAPEMLGRLIG